MSEVHAGGAPVHVGPGAPKRRGSARSSGANCKCAEEHSVAVRIDLASLGCVKVCSTGNLENLSCCDSVHSLDTSRCF